MNNVIDGLMCIVFKQKYVKLNTFFYIVLIDSSVLRDPYTEKIFSLNHSHELNNLSNQEIFWHYYKISILQMLILP